MTGLGKALLALIEDLPGQLGELRTQLVASRLQILQALLMGLLLFVQLGAQARVGGAQRTQLGLLRIALGMQIVEGFPSLQALGLQPLRLPAQGRQLGLQQRTRFGEVGLLLLAALQLSAEPLLRQRGLPQALVEQRLLGVAAR